jgi:hypothetical protein
MEKLRHDGSWQEPKEVISFSEESERILRSEQEFEKVRESGIAGHRHLEN